MGGSPPADVLSLNPLQQFTSKKNEKTGSVSCQTALASRNLKVYTWENIKNENPHWSLLACLMLHLIYLRLKSLLPRASCTQRLLIGNIWKWLSRGLWNCSMSLMERLFRWTSLSIGWWSGSEEGGPPQQLRVCVCVTGGIGMISGGHWSVNCVTQC